MAKLTYQQLHSKASSLRRAYAASSLSKRDIKAIEKGIPGWKWDLEDPEDHALDMTGKVAEFYHKYGKYPSHGSKDPKGKKLGTWLKTQRRSKADKGYGIFYPSCERLAKQLGCPDMFEQVGTKDVRELYALKMTRKSCEFYHRHGKYPSHVSRDPEVKKLGRWMHQRRQAKKGKGTGSLHHSSSCENLAKELGCAGIFDNIDLEAKSLEMTRKISEFYHKHGRYPSGKSKDPEEKKLGQWLGQYRNAKQGKGHRIFYPSCEKLAKQLGCSDMFALSRTSEARESHALEMTRKSCEFYHRHGKYPSNKSKDPEEKKLGGWLSNMRKTKQGKGNHIFYPSCKKLAKKLGCPDMFKPQRRSS